MSIDPTSSRRDDEIPAGTDGSRDRSAEQTSGQPAAADDDRGHRRAETLTREQYADAMRAGGSPIRRDSPGSSESDGRANAKDADRAADRDTPAPHDGERDGDHAVMVQDEPDHAGPTAAEPLTREEYSDAMRGNGLDDGDHERASEPGAGQDRAESARAAAVTHFHGEFKDQQLDLYTDGTRWATADTPRTQVTVSEKGGIPDRLPTGEELVDSSGEGSSLLERLRREVYQESEDETDALEKEANLAHDVFSHPPTSSYEGTPSQPYISGTQHSGIDAGSAATAIFAVGLMIDRAVQWAVGHYDKHAKGR